MGEAMVKAGLNEMHPADARQALLLAHARNVLEAGRLALRAGIEKHLVAQAVHHAAELANALRERACRESGRDAGMGEPHHMDAVAHAQLAPAMVVMLVMLPGELAVTVRGVSVARLSWLARQSDPLSRSLIAPV